MAQVEDEVEFRNSVHWSNNAWNIGIRAPNKKPK